MRNYIMESQRLGLRELMKEDAEQAFLLNEDEEVLRYTGDEAFESVEEAEKFLANYSDYKRNGYGRWAVIRKEDEVFLGWCGLKLHSDGAVDIGYRFHQKYWGKGYATEAAKTCLDYGFNELKMNQIIGRTAKANLASIQVLKKLGMTYWKDEPCKGIEDSIIYQLNRKDYLIK